MTVAIYIVHDVDALKELEQKAYWLNNIVYDQNTDFLSTIRYEALYCAFILTKQEFNKDKIICELNDLADLPESINLFNNELYSAVKIKNEITSYGIALFNKWCGFDKILIKKSITKSSTQDISELIYLNCGKDNQKYYDTLTDLEKKLFTFISLSKYTPSLDASEMVNLKDEETDRLLKMLPDNNIMLGYHINEALVERCLHNFDKESNLYKLYKSGSRFSRAQLARSCISIGYSADAENNVVPTPIKTSLLEGLTEEEFFIVAPGTRKSIKDKAKFTPDSGYLERTVVMALSILELDMDDCKTDRYLEVLVTSQKHAMTLIGKWYRDPQEYSSEWKVLTFAKAKEFINRKIQIRSPMTCETPGFKLCRKCFGTRVFPTKYVGITAGQNLVERITQLILRTFHESGRADLEVDKQIKDFFMNHLIDIKKENGTTTLFFNSSDFPESLINNSVIQGLISVGDTSITFGEDKRIIPNEDVISIMNQIKLILRASKVNRPPVEYYQDLMALLLNVGTVYSSFAEMLFANMFLVGELEDKRFWRYYQDETPTYKLGDKMMAAYISPLLGLLYQPNRNSIDRIDILSDNQNLTIYEKIWLGKI